MRYRIIVFTLKSRQTTIPARRSSVTGIPTGGRSLAMWTITKECQSNITSSNKIKTVEINTDRNWGRVPVATQWRTYSTDSIRLFSGIWDVLLDLSEKA